MSVSVYNIEWGGRTREAALHIPDNPSTKLILAFHGGSGNVVGFAGQTRLHEKTNALICYPQGTNYPAAEALGDYTWNPQSIVPKGWAELSGIDDIGFIKQLIKQIKADHVIKEVMGIGLSKGGMMVYRLASIAGHMFSRIAVVSSTMSCAPETTTFLPTSLLHIHSSDDSVIPVGGDTGSGYPKIWDGLNWFAGINGGSFPLIPATFDDSVTYTEHNANKLKHNAQTILRMYHGGNHDWDWTGFNTTSQVLSFCLNCRQIGSRIYI